MTAEKYWYNRYYNRAWRFLTEFYWWSVTEGRTYDIFHGDFKKAWRKYMRSDDEFAVRARKEYARNETAQRAFRDYVKKYIEELRQAEAARGQHTEGGAV